jgi:RNA polymerase sigma factor (sigma-70 family)
LSARPDEREELYRKHAAGAYRRALRLIGNAADASEVVHDVFVSLFESSTHSQIGHMNAYLYGAVTHACLKRLRTRRTRARIDTERPLALDSHPGTQAESALIARATLASMPEELAQVAVYYYLDELSHREIADVLGCSHRHVGNLLQRLTRWAEREELRTCQR